MGLSAFEECSSSSSYCCPAMNRSLTKRLIELSSTPSQSTSRFAHTPEWADGLDTWTFTQHSMTKMDLSRRNLDFHDDIGLYLPRSEKPKSAPTPLKTLQINPKVTQNTLPPERIRHLLRKEKDLLSRNDSSDAPLTSDPSPQVPANTFRSSTSLELIPSHESRLPFRNSIPKPSSTPDQQLNQDALKSLLEEHFTSLLTRGASTVNGNRTTIISVPSLDSKQPSRTDSKLTDKRDELMPTPLSTVSTTHFIVHQKSSLGLTVTPVDVSPQRNFQSVSLEKLAQQRSFLQENETASSISSTRPSTEPVSFPPPTHRYQQQQKVVLKRNLDTTKPSSGELLVANETSPKFSEQTQMFQTLRKGHTHHGSNSKGKPQRPNRTTTIELLPPIVSGKRVHISLANHRYL